MVRERLGKQLFVRAPYFEMYFDNLFTVPVCFSADDNTLYMPAH